MLNDLYTLETFYGTSESPQFFADLAERYGLDKLALSLEAGDIENRPINIGPDAGQALVMLTEQGRRKVSTL